MSNINFEAALKYIDLGSYDKAVEKLKLAIDEESSKDKEFTQVIQFADENSTLDTQRSIAQTYINAFEGLLPPIPSANTEPANRPGDVPLVPKPVQNKGFISRQMNKKHR